MTDPDALARLHARCFTAPPPWSAQAFAGFLADPLCHLCVDDPAAPRGFALLRAVVDEAELLTLAVHPDARRQGLAARLLRQGLAALPQARLCYLEVASDNHAARALYAALGFAQTGLRRGYYTHPDGTTRDALILQATLPLAGPDARFSC